VRFHANVMRCGMKESGPGFKAAAGIGCTNTLQRVVVGNFIESTAAADQRHRNELLKASGKQQASGTKISSCCSSIVRRVPLAVSGFSAYVYVYV
jgi:hypothetical protein